MKMKVEIPKDIPVIVEGDYEAEIEKIETNVDGQYGKMVRLFFSIDDKLIPAVASQKLNAKTKLYEWITAITGKKLDVDDEFDINSLEGKKALVTVQTRKILDDDGKPAKGRDGKELEASQVIEVNPIK